MPAGPERASPPGGTRSAAVADTTASRRPGGRSALRWTIQITLTVVVTAFVLRRLGFTFDEVTALDLGRWQPRWGLLSASAVVLAVGYAFSGWLWARMVREMGGRALPMTTAVRIYMVANLGRYVPGKVLQIAGLAWLSRREGVPPGTAMAAAVVGQGVALLGATSIGLVAFFGPDPRYRAIGWIGVGLTALFVAATSVPPTARLLERLWRGLAGRAGEESPPPVAKAGFGLRWTAWYALNWGVYAAAFWLFFMALEGPASFLEVGPAFAAAYLVGYLVLFAPAGAGVRESALVVFLLPVVSREAALALAVAARLWTTLVEVVPAGVLALTHARRGGPDASLPDSSDSHSTA